MTEIKVGDTVSWVCKTDVNNQFECVGTVIEIRESIFGSSKKAMGAKIEVDTALYIKRMGRKTTTVSIKNLTKIHENN